MSEPADYALCEKFEANMFAKNRCQNCLRTIAAHQHGNQVFKKDAINLPNCIASTSESDPGGDPWDPLCILASQCKIYVYVGSEDRRENQQERLEYTQLNSNNEESEAADTCPDASNTLSTDADSNAMLSEDQEMTRLLSNILESEKENSLHIASLKKKVQSEKVHSDRHRWAEATSCRRTVSWSCLKPGGLANESFENSVILQPHLLRMDGQNPQPSYRLTSTAFHMKWKDLGRFSMQQRRKLGDSLICISSHRSGTTE